MRDCKNYVVVFYNSRFHSKEEAVKRAHINNYIKELSHSGENVKNAVEIKEICFNKKNKPIAYVYFYADGNAQQIAEAFSEQTDKKDDLYNFKIKLGKDKINAPTKFSNDENNIARRPRPIIIDGSNVGLSHGCNKVFSSSGLKRAIEYFEDKGHLDIKCVIKRKQLFATKSDHPTQDIEILEDLMHRQLILLVDNDIYDDKIILEQAVRKFAVIISNDRFGDDQFKNSAEISNYLKEPNVLQFFFHGGMFNLKDIKLNGKVYEPEYVLNMNRTNELVAETEESLSSLRMNGEHSIIQSREDRSYVQAESRLNNEPNGQRQRKRNDIDDNERGTGKATNNTYSSVLKTKPSRHDIRSNGSVCRLNDGETDEEFTQIYIKHIDKSYNESNIRQLFEKFGEITSVVIFNGYNGRPNGCCRVEYTNSKSASKAIHKMNGFQLDQSQLEVEQYIPRVKEQSRKSTMATKLFVGNLNKDISNNDLYELFEKYGNLVKAKIININDTNRNYGIVKFRDRYSAQSAIDELNGDEIPSISAPKMTLSVKYFTSKA